MSPTASTIDFLAGVQVLELSTRASGGQCGRLLRLFGASVSRVAFEPVVDCPPHVLEQFTRTLHEGKVSIEVDDHAGQSQALRASSLLVVDSLHDDACDGIVERLTGRLVDARPSSCAVIDISANCAADGTPLPASSLMTGAASGVSWTLGHPNREPLSLPFDIPEFLAGTEAAVAAALELSLGRIEDRAPGYWDVCATDVLTYYIGQIGTNYRPYGRPWHRDGARATMSGGSYPCAMFPCKDGWISVMCRTPREYAGLLAALGNPEWSRVPGYDDPRIVAREHADEIDVHVTAWTRAHTRDEIFDLAHQHGFATGPVLTLEETLTHDHLHDRDYFRRTPDTYLVPGSPIRVSRAPSTTAAAKVHNHRRPTPQQPLGGLRVLDMTWVWAGPMVTAALADLGATVIKVEHRSRLDPGRLRGPALGSPVDPSAPDFELAPFFNQVNHGKQSIEVDLKTPEGVDIVRRLAAESDVLVENMRPGALERNGLGYEQLAKLNEDLIVVSMSVFGQTGPMRGVGGYAPVMSGLSGLDSIVGYGDDLIGTFNPAVGDANGAAHATFALLSALRAQEAGRGGCQIDVSQLEALISIQLAPILMTQILGPVHPPGNSHSRFALHGTYRCSGPDEWVAIAARDTQEQRALTAIVGTDDDLEKAVELWAARRSAGSVEELLTSAGVPAARVVGWEAVDSQRSRQRGIIRPVHHLALGEQRVMVPPWHCNGRTFHHGSAAPLLGADTQAVLSTMLGMSERDIADLRDRGIVAGPNQLATTGALP